MLKHFFKRRQVDLEEDDGDDTKQLECWELKDPSKTVSWTALWAAHTPHLTIATSFAGNINDPMVIDVDTRITEFDPETTDVLKIICSSPGPDPYIFSIAVDTVKTPFDPMYMLDSLDASNFDEIKSTLKSDILEGKWKTKQGGPLKAKPLSFKLRNIINSMIQAAIAAKAKTVPHRAGVVEGSGLTATGSPVQSRTSNRVQPATPRPQTTAGHSSGSPATSTPGKKRTPSTRKSAEVAQKKNKLISEEEAATSINDALKSIPMAVDKVEDIDYNNANVIYQKFFSDCQDAFVFENKPHTKIEIDTMKMKNAPVEWTIRALEKRGQTSLLNYLINLPDRSQKQTLCVMPDLPEKPTSEAELIDCEFWIINGQHSVAASKMMIEGNTVPESIRKDFRTWNAFIVWTTDIDKLRKISAFYNRVNHFTQFKPTWATNILAARQVWEKYGRPPNRHAAAGVAESRVKAKRVANQHVQYDVRISKT